LTATLRQHRWARGDWQLLPWILRERVTPVERWKMFDNLRRTLSMPASYFRSCSAGRGRTPRRCCGRYSFRHHRDSNADSIGGGNYGRAPKARRSAVTREPSRGFPFSFYQTFVLAHHARASGVTMMDAIVRSMFRMCVTRRKLLQWLPAAHATPRRPLDLC